MNILGKIFVFAVFVMSLVFMSFAIALYSTHTNWKEEILRESNEVRVGKPLGWKAQLTEAKKDREKAQGEIDTLKSEVAASEAARDQVVAKIQTALEEKNQELVALREEKVDREKERAEAQEEVAKARDELKELTAKIDGLRTQVKTQQSAVDEQVSRAAKLAIELHEQESFLAIANERKAQLEKQVANARLLLKQGGLSVDSLPRDQLPAIDGVVTAVVNDSIEVSLGGQDGVQMGHFLEVYRNNQYVGRVKVVSVKADKAMAVVIREFSRGSIQAGDRVATKLKA